MTEKNLLWLESLREYESEVAAKRKFSFEFTPLQNAQFEIAKRHLQNKNYVLRGKNWIVAFVTDLPGLAAFGSVFPTPNERQLCFTKDEWEAFRKPSAQGRKPEFGFVYAYHAFARDDPKQQISRFQNRPLPPEFSAKNLWVRRWGEQSHARAGIGGSDLWHFDGQNLVKVPGYESAWIS